jgi:hypothetical protein
MVGQSAVESIKYALGQQLLAREGCVREPRAE